LAEIAHLKEMIKNNELTSALSFARELLKKEPQNDKLYFLLGKIFLLQGKYQEAEIFTKAALDLFAKEEYLLQAATISNQKNEPERALSYLDKITLKNHNKVDYLLNRAISKQKQGNFAETEQLYLDLLKVSPEEINAYLNLGVLKLWQNELLAAEKFLLQAREKAPDNPLIYFNLALLKEKQTEYSPALAYYQKALQLKPDYPEALYNLSLLEQANGDYQKGLRNYEWRFYTNDHHYQLLKNNLLNPQSDLAEVLAKINGKKILVRAEEGLGDFLQFVRYLKFFHSFSPDIFLETPPELKNFLEKALIPKVKIVTAEKLVDFSIPLRSLPFLFSEICPAPYYEKYFNFIPEKKYSTLFAKSQKKKIGIVWKGNPCHLEDQLRSSALKDWEILLGNRQFEFFSLQKGLNEEEEVILQKYQISNLEKLLTDFTETAELISELDLLISVDTSVAHLAGAMEKDTFLLLAKKSDLRWQAGVWYPKTKIFRQKNLGAWPALFQELNDYLND